MPRNQGTSRKGKPKREMRSAGFGKSLQRSQTKRFVPKSNGSSAHGQGMIATGAQSIGVDEPSEGATMKSVLEMDDLSDFLLQAQLANRDFRSEREQFLDIDDVAAEYVPTGRQPAAIILEDGTPPRAAVADPGFAFRELGVPRRPEWTPGVTTPEELEAMENESFLEWRRGVARREEEAAARAFASGRGGAAGESVTPYERNLHVWRQLWRVLERSAVVVQIVDARNPLFYMSEDLRVYAMDELGKPMLILVNKSDYLTGKQRAAWSDYLTSRGIDHVFFSAHDEQKKIDSAVAAAKRRGVAEEKRPDDDDENDSNMNVAGIAVASSKSAKSKKKGSAKPSIEVAQQAGNAHSASRLELKPLQGVSKPLSREQLLDALEAFANSHGCTPDERCDNRVQYGMVGFPNVGKSSVINVLVGTSKAVHGVARVGVAAQPGKTKHFQTLLLPGRPQAMLCDCPGLVFPSLVSSVADMVAGGVTPIAQMRDHWPVVGLICARVPRSVLNTHYGIKLPEPSQLELRERRWEGKDLPPPTAEELLGTYCIARSMLAPASGVPDYQRAARVVVKDYTEGRLLYCHPPPPFENGGKGLLMQAGEYKLETLKTAIQNTKNAKKLRKLEQSLDTGPKLTEMELVPDEEDGLDVFDSILGEAGDDKPSGDKRGKAHKTIKKWGKKGRKLRNKDPYGCHSDPDTALQPLSAGSGVFVNAGKYSGSYTRANYAGAKAATPFEGHGDRSKRGRNRM